MGALRAIKKKLRNNDLRFEAEMYNNTLGSIVICGFILGGSIGDVQAINKKWRKLKKNPDSLGFWLDDEKFIDKALDLFGLEKPKVFPIAMVQSKLNVLFMPYINEQLHALREDGTMPNSAYNGKIYPIEG